MTRLQKFDPARHEGDPFVAILNALIDVHNALDDIDLEDVVRRVEALEANVKSKAKK